MTPGSPAHTDLDVLQEDASSPVVLEGQQLLGMLPLLVAVLLEEMGKTWESHIVPGEVEGLRDTEAERTGDKHSDQGEHHPLLFGLNRAALTQIVVKKLGSGQKKMSHDLDQSSCVLHFVKH